LKPDEIFVLALMIVCVAVVVAVSRHSRATADSRPTRDSLSRVRIERALPAPMMDGFDVHAFQVGRAYEVDERLARHLITAGYAVALADTSPPRGSTQKRRL